MNRKSQVDSGILSVIILLILSFALIVFFAMWVYAFDIVTDTLLAVPSTETINLTDAAERTFVHVNIGLGGLRMLAFVLILGQVILILGINISKSSNPILFSAYVLVNIVGVVLAVIISNSYETLLANNVIGSALGSFRAGSFIMLNLPVFATVIGFLGVIFLLINISRDRGLEGSGGL